MRTGKLRRDLLGHRIKQPPNSIFNCIFSQLHTSPNDPNMRSWPDCWVSVEYLHASIPRKGSGSTTTTLICTVHTLLHHSSGSRYSPDVLLTPTFLAPTCEWRIFPGLGCDHLTIDISIALATLTHCPCRQLQKSPLG